MSPGRNNSAEAPAIEISCWQQLAWSGKAWGPHTFRSVQCAMYAARSNGFTAVPVIHGIEAVLTIATCLREGQRLNGTAALWHIRRFSPNQVGDRPSRFSEAAALSVLFLSHTPAKNKINTHLFPKSPEHKTLWVVQSFL